MSWYISRVFYYEVSKQSRDVHLSILQFQTEVNEQKNIIDVAYKYTEILHTY